MTDTLRTIIIDGEEIEMRIDNYRAGKPVFTGAVAAE